MSLGNYIVRNAGFAMAGIKALERFTEIKLLFLVNSVDFYIKK